MRNNMLPKDLQFLCDQVVGGFLWGGSNDIRLIKHGGDVEMYNDRRINVLRFSFLIDLFLLSQFRKYDYDYFVDDPKLIFKIETAMRNGKSLDFMKKEKRKYSSWKPSKSEETFIMTYDPMFNHETNFVDTLLRLEGHIKKIEFDRQFKIYKNEERLKHSIKMYRQNRKKKNNLEDSEESEESSQDEEMSNQDESNNTSAKSTTPSEILGKRSNMEKSEDEKKSEDDNKSESPPPKHVPKALVPIKPVSKMVAYSIKRRAPKLEVSFYDFGVEYLKAHANFECMEVDEITPSEKKLLLSLVAHLETFPEKKELAQILQLMLVQKVNSVKEYLRSLNLMASLLKQSQMHIKNSRLKMELLHVIMKMEVMGKVLEEKVFAGNRNLEVDERAVVRGGWFVDFLAR
jgi:hypothetical protein